VALAGAVTTAGAAAALRRRLLRRPLPKVEGELQVEGASAPLTIARDRFGVPRVQALTREDLAFGQGFCHGQDRLWQLELYRRFASGRLSEFAGEEGLRMDVLMRALGFRRRAEEEVDRVPETVRQLLEAYAAGVNAAVAEARALPFELQLLRLEPEPWTPADSLAVSKVLALGFSTNMETELFRAELVRRVGAERAARLEPPYPDGNPLVVDPGGAWTGDGLTLIDQIREVRDKLGLGLQPAASNNWVVSGARSVTGRPLLAGDPHITTSIPDVWYQIELSAPGIELAPSRTTPAW
jgi:penicillin amidase